MDLPSKSICIAKYEISYLRKILSYKLASLDKRPEIALPRWCYHKPVDSLCCCNVDASWGVSGRCWADDVPTVVSDGVRGWSDWPSSGVQIWLPLNWLPTGVGGSDAAWSPPPLFCRAVPVAAGTPVPALASSAEDKKLLLIWDRQPM